MSGKAIGKGKIFMSNVLITGGAGFIGFSVVKKLAEEEGNSITIIDNLSRGKMDDEFRSLIEMEQIEYINADLTDPSVFSDLPGDIDYIYHFAAVIGVKNVMKHPDRVLYVNAVSTLNILEYAKGLSDLKKILFSSTSEVYAGTLKHYGIGIPTDEMVHLTIEDIRAERTTYALSKIFGESSFFNYGRQFSIPFTIVRYHNVYGPRMGFDHVIPEQFVKIYRNNQIHVPSPHHSRAFCYIDDAVEMTIRVCESNKTEGEIFHIGNSDQEIRIKDLILLIAQIMNKEIKIIEEAETPGSPKRRCPDVSKVTTATGYGPVVSLEEGIRKTYSWYEDKLNQITKGI